MHFPLCELAEVRLGYPFRTRVVPAPQGETALVQLADLNGGELALKDLVRIHLESIRAHFCLRPGDILFRARSQVNDATLVTGVEAGPGIVRVVAAAPIVVIRPRTTASPRPGGHEDVPAVRPRYLHWLLNHPQIRAVLRSQSTGHSAEVLRKGDLEGLSLPAPPPEVQELIVETAAELERELRLRRTIMEERRDMVLSLLWQHAATTERLRGGPQAAEGRAPRQGLLFGDDAAFVTASDGGQDGGR